MSAFIVPRGQRKAIRLKTAAVRALAMDAACPQCAAQPGACCVSSEMSRLSNPHKARVLAGLRGGAP